METSNPYFNYFVDVVILMYGVLLANVILALALSAVLLASILRILPTVVLGFKPLFAVAFRANLIAGMAVLVFNSIVVAFLVFVLEVEEELSESHTLISVLFSAAIWAVSSWRFLKGPDGRRLNVVRVMVVTIVFYTLWSFCFMVFAGSLGYLSMILLT